MFGRRSAQDGSLAAVAQRRLTALAQQFEETRAGTPRIGAPVGDALFAPERESDQAADRAEHGGSGRHARPARPRLLLTAHQVAIVALLALVAALVAAWWVVRSVPDPQPVQLTSERQPAPSALPDSGAPSASTPTDGAPDLPASSASVVVDVAGKVRRPGIVELSAGSRVVDALRAAGGPRPHANTSGLNLARVLVDGEQIIVGVSGSTPGPLPLPPGTPAAPTLTLAPVDLNLATQLDLEALPGIGPVTAAAILAWRAEHGAFSSVEELLEVSGIGDVTLAEIAPFVHV